MGAAHPLATDLDIALEKIGRGDPLTEAEEHLVDAHTPKLTPEDFTIGEEVDPEAFLAYLRGERAQEPCSGA